MKRGSRQRPRGEATPAVPGARSLVVFGAVTLAVAAVVAFAAVAAGGDGPARTGAEAPEAAVIQLHDAVDELDTDRALALMPPGEAAELRAPPDRLQRSLEAIGVEAPTWLPALPPVSVVGTERIEEDVVRVALAYPGGDVDDHLVTVRRSRGFGRSSSKPCSKSEHGPLTKPLRPLPSQHRAGRSGCGDGTATGSMAERDVRPERDRRCAS